MNIPWIIFAMLAMLQYNDTWVLATENLQKAPSVASISAVIAVAPRMVANAVDSGCPPDGSGKAWKLEGKVSGDEIFIDFSPKEGHKDLLGKWEDATSGIKFPDDNKWTKK